MEETKKSEKPAPKKGNTVLGFIIMGILAVIIIVALVSSLGGSGKKAKYTATVDTSNIVVINPATVSLSFQVKNTGNAAGQPWCTLQASDANDTYSGTDYFQLSSPIQPGQTSTSADSLTITNQGAQYVTQATISCN